MNLSCVTEVRSGLVALTWKPAKFARAMELVCCLLWNYKPDSETVKKVLTKAEQRIASVKGELMIKLC